MIPFTSVIKPFQADFYSIYEYLGKKHIHINGYTYRSDSKEFVTEDNPNGIYWANVEVCWFIFTLDEFIDRFRNEDMFVDSVYEGLTQYQDDLTTEEMTNTINEYFNGYGADGYLSFGDLTEDTPCGNYINLN